MIPIETLPAMLVVIVCFVLVLATRRSDKPLRQPPAVSQLSNALVDSIEKGERVHLALGNGALLSPGNGPALANLSTYRQLQRVGLASDRPVVASSADAVTSFLAQDIARTIADNRQQSSLYSPLMGRLAGVSPMSYALGAGLHQHSDRVQTLLMLGEFGAEGQFVMRALPDEAVIVAASSTLTGQAVALSAATQALIGEEQFVLPAYLVEKSHPVPAMMDILRWIVIVIVFGGSIFQLLMVLGVLGG